MAEGSSVKNSRKKSKNTRQNVAAELSSLRTLAKEIIHRYQSNLEAEIIWCINALSNAEEELSAKANDQDQLEILLKPLVMLTTKPEKGRLKDIKKIHRIVKYISKTLME
ncbi:hypothetical protein JW935_18920 [candidate division KSB1 bacterium]|nr:hypothetical protein [candidate division KSB1 bacterium]